MLPVTYFPHPPHQFDSGCPGKPAGTAHCPAPRQCQYRCWSGTWWPGSGGRQRWKCPRCWWTSFLGKLARLRPKKIQSEDLFWAGWRGRVVCSMWDFSSLTRDWTCAHSLEARSLNHWTTREVPGAWKKTNASFKLFPQSLYFLKERSFK